MYSLAILDSGNHAFSLCRVLERKGYVFEVVAIPCQIARGGCGYCIKLPRELEEFIINEGIANNTKVREMYRIIPMGTRNRYEKVY